MQRTKDIKINYELWKPTMKRSAADAANVAAHSAATRALNFHRPKTGIISAPRTPTGWDLKGRDRALYLPASR